MIKKKKQQGSTELWGIRFRELQDIVCGWQVSLQVSLLVVDKQWEISGAAIFMLSQREIKPSFTPSVQLVPLQTELFKLRLWTPACREPIKGELQQPCSGVSGNSLFSLQRESELLPPWTLADFWICVPAPQQTMKLQWLQGKQNVFMSFLGQSDHLQRTIMQEVCGLLGWSFHQNKNTKLRRSGFFSMGKVLHADLR